MVTFAIRVRSRSDIEMGIKIFILYIGIMLLLGKSNKFKFLKIKRPTLVLFQTEIRIVSKLPRRHFNRAIQEN